MKEKYNQRYENQIALLARDRVKTGNYKVFDFQARVITRDQFPDLVEKGRTDIERCLVITNSEGETIVITREFEAILRNALIGC
ncbi:MAG TPA: hypothetical protein VF556_09750 [Pyrinomonadaceae bacterium]|jgi:hypothetical protein